jgi:hypothetical protein
MARFQQKDTIGNKVNTPNFIEAQGSTLKRNPPLNVGLYYSLSS